MTTQEEISAEMAAISEEYVASGTTETAVRLDYPPYRSSLLRHPTKSPVQVDPEGIESVVVETRSEEYVGSRIRAGILEQSTVDLLRATGL
ncbi:MAG: hypothetical protein ABIO16_05070, partial [Nocardioides sp.]